MEEREESEEEKEASKKAKSPRFAKKRSRLKTWQQLWLDRHRDELLRRCQGVVRDIVDCLVREKVMDPSMDETCQYIQSDYTLPVNKSRRLLDFLHDESPRVFGHFLAALAAHGCEDLVPSDEAVRALEAQLELLPVFERLSVELGIPRSVVRARELLQSMYTEAASEVHMLAGISRGGEGRWKDLEDVFVNIGLVSSDEVEKVCSEWTGKDGGVDRALLKALTAQGVRLCDLLKAREEGGRDPVRVSALGTAGSGKSFAFTMKAPYDWCRGRCWEQIVLLRTIQCRDKSVWRAESISELFGLRKLGLRPAEVEEVEAFIADHPKHVALVCDGLDEGIVDEDSLLWGVLTGQTARGLRVIATSRPCSAVCRLSLNGAFHRHVQLYGFSEENIREFAVKYLGEHKGQEMLSLLAKQPSIATLMHTPFFALLICEQFKEAGQLAQRRTEVFNNVALRLVQRFAASRKLDTRCRSLERSPFYESVLEVGKVAFDRLKRKDLSYFELGDEGLSPEAVNLGFLVHVHGTASSEDQYGFRHLTIQEYLAALYTCTKTLRSAGDVAKLVGELGCGEEAGHLNTFWVFVAGLLDSSLREELLCAIAGTDVQTVTRLMHASNSSDAQGSASSLPGGDGGCTSDREEDNQPIALEPLGTHHFLLLLHCSQEMNTDQVAMASPCIVLMLKKQGMVLSNCRGLSHSDVCAISAVAEQYNRVVKKVQLMHLYLNDDTLATLLTGLTCFTHLKELSVGICGANLKYAALLSNVLLLNNNNHSLETVEFAYLFRQKWFLYVAPALQNCTHLVKLHLLHVGLTAGDGGIPLLASTLRALPQLQELNIGENLIHDEGFRLLPPVLQRCSRLRILHINDCGLTNRGLSVPLLASVLHNLQHLQDLRISGNFFGDAGLRELSPALEQCSKLTVLRISNIRLTSPASMFTICQLIRQLNRLVELRMRVNSCGGGDGDLQLYEAVKEHASLKTLHIPHGVTTHVRSKLFALKYDPDHPLTEINLA